MRIKPVPEPPADLEELARIQRAVPLVPGSEDDCCARLRDRIGLANRQVANDWLAFLRTLELAEETPAGFKRTDRGPTSACVRERLLDGVLLAPDALALVREANAADPVTPSDLFAATRESVPRHDRERDPEWETAWRERAGRLLEWFVLVDLAERAGRDNCDAERYVVGDAARDAARGEYSP